MALQSPKPLNTLNNSSRLNASGASSRGLNSASPRSVGSSDTLLHALDTNSPSLGLSKKTLIMIAIFVIVAGTGTGYLLAGAPTARGTDNTSGSMTSGFSALTSDSSTEEGMNDPQHFPDTVEGELQANDGSVTQEGTHILIRPGGVSQTVYVNSSIVDMDKYIGKKVQVRGQTQTSQKAGWLMEVGWLKVL